MLSQNPEYKKRKENEKDEEQQQQPSDRRINPKLKQFYDVKIKIEPFYTGGKISIMSPSHFLCQCGPAIKVISTAEKENARTDSAELMEIDNVESSKEKKIDPNKGSFAVIGHYECELDEILSFDACPASESLVTGHKSNLLRIWDLNTQEVERTIKSFHSLPIGILEIHKSKSVTQRRLANLNREIKMEDDDKILSATTTDTTLLETRNKLTWVTLAGAIVKIWDAGGSRVSKAIRIENVAGLGFARWDQSGDRNRLLVAERNIYVIEWHDESQQYVISHTCEGHFSQVTGIEWTENNIMISGGRDQVIILWDTANSFRKIKTIPIPGAIEALSLMSSKDLYIALSTSEIRHFNVRTHRLSNRSQLPLSSDENIVALYSPAASNFLASESLEQFFISTHTCAIYQVEKKSKEKCDTDNYLKITKQYVGSLDEILAVALWTNEKVAVANNTSIIKVYTLSSGSCEFLRGHKDIVLSLSTQKEWLVSGSKDNKIIFWSATSSDPVVALEGHIASVTSVCFDPTKFIAYSVSEDTFLKAWDVTRCIRSARAHEKEVHAVTCSPNGAMLATASRDKTAKLWDADTLTLTGTLKGHRKTVWDVKFSNWDQLVCTSSADTTIKVWNISSFECLQTLQGHLSSVLQSTFINAGLQILSTSSDGTFKSWELRSSTCLSTWECSDDKVWGMDCNSDGSLVVTGAADSVLTVWIDVTQDKVKESLTKTKKIVEDEQQLANVLRKNEWSEAVRLAIELDRPFTLLKVIREISDIKDLDPIIKALPQDHKFQMMRYIKQWNTNTRTSTEAQVLLNIVLSSTVPSKLGNLETTALIPYTEKHFHRLQKTAQHISLVQFIANQTVD